MTTDNLDILKVKEELKQLGLSELHELLFYLPIRYFDFTKTVSRTRDGLDVDDAVFFRARITRPSKVKPRSQQNRVASVCVYANDGYEDFTINVFGDIWDWKDLEVGKDIFAMGKVSLWEGRVTVKSAKYVPSHKTNGIVPQYRIKKVKVGGKQYDLSSDQIHYYIGAFFTSSLTKACMELCNYVGLLESDIIEKTGVDIPSLKEFFRYLHFPKNNEEVSKATKAITAIHALKVISDASESRALYPSEQSVINIPVDVVAGLVKKPPFSLNIEQKRAIWQIMEKLASPYPCDHLLSGDVGCGKTIVYAVIAVASQMVGKNVAIMIPNLPLATQVKDEISGTFDNADVEFVEKGSDLAFDVNKRNPILIGTSALLNWIKKNKGYQPDLFIIDEQQKTGTSQKDLVLHDSLNIIEATATALPRTLMLAMLGKKSVSKIENPPVEKDIESVVSFADSRRQIFNDVKEEVKKGNKVCFLYPLREQANEVTIKIQSIGFCWHSLSKFNLRNQIKKVEFVYETKREFATIARISKDSDSFNPIPIETIVIKRDQQAIDSLRNFLANMNVQNYVKDTASDVSTAFDEWSKIYPDKVVMLHGGLSNDDKVSAIRAAKSSDKSIIIASSIIEVGITIPNLTLLVVVDPENMGISTLHQIRGRLARLGGYGKFVMLLKALRHEVDEDAIIRLRAIEKFKKGSELAEQDMLIRGFGDVSNVGVSQSGHLKSLFKGIKLLPEDIFGFIKEKLG